MFALLGGPAHTNICASPDLCTICALHLDLRCICNSITVTDKSEVAQIQPAEQEAATTDENTIVVTFQEARIGIKFGKLGSSKACKSLALMQIKELSGGGDALRKYDSILQVGMTLTKVQETLVLNQCGYSYNTNHWVSSQIQNAVRPLVLTFQRPSPTADQTATLLS